MFLGDTLTTFKGTRGVHINNSDLDFFDREMKGGCTVYYYGTYEVDGDFGTFSKIISCIKFTKEQRELFNTPEEEVKFFEKFEELYKSNDEELISVDFDIVEE